MSVRELAMNTAV